MEGASIGCGREADFVLVLTGRGFDPTFGHAGAEVAVFPALSDGETLAGFVGQFRTDPPGAKPPRTRLRSTVRISGSS